MIVNKAIKYLIKNKMLPEGVYAFNKHDFTNYIYHVIMSERSIGKTTSALLVGLKLYLDEGVTTIYMRQLDTMIRPKTTRLLFDVILSNKYIEKLTEGKYNGVYIFSRYFYLCYYNEEGERILTDDRPFCIAVALNEQFDLKSTFNCPSGNWIIFDEFISNRYAKDEFIIFMDMLSTIIRQREEPRIILLSNTIDTESQYFYDFEIADTVQHMEFGEICDITTSKGTRIQVELAQLDGIRRKVKEKHNRLFFGFSNSKIKAITGGGWSIDSYTHPFGDFSVIFNKCYIKYNDKYIKADFVYNKTINKAMIYFHKASKIYDDSFIITNTTCVDTREYGVESELYSTILEHINQNLCMYQNNTIGTMISKFFKK